ncbi:MAG: hypothetical protein EOM84_00150 [Sphingobacteriia bacterium]|nr:hypothetical protein [Sphingobacteriia bacterium]
MRRCVDKVKNIKILDGYVIGLFFALIFSFLYFTGTLTSGYHFIDDHSMISMQKDLNNGSFLETAYAYIKNDFNIRFRPLFYFYYISEIQVFGLNFFILSVFTGVLAVCTFLFFYFGLRKLKYNNLESLLFVLLIFVGPQMAIWWRLGTNETIGMFFLGLTFLFMGKCTKTENYRLNNFLFIIFLIIASLCKESFIITIPAFVFFKIWNEKKVFDITAKESIKNNYLSAVPLFIMFIELSIIKFVVGTNQIGYAGVTSSINELILGIKNIVFNKNSLLSWFKFIGGLFILYLLSFIFIKNKKKNIFSKSLESFVIYFCFSFFLVLPNILMHAKSGMVERYLLPTTFGLAIFAIGMMKNIKHLFFKASMFLIIAFFIFNSFEISKNNAVSFAIEGSNTNHFFKSIRKEIKRSDSVLLVVDPVGRYEVSYSIKTYLSYYGFNDFYAYPIFRNYKNDFEIGLKEQWIKWFEGKNLKDMKEDPDLIIVFDKENSNKFFIESGVDGNNYRKVLEEIYSYQIYIKND